MAEWCISGSRYAKLPAGKFIILPSSNLSPIPTLKLPETTVTFSRLGWKWGAILYPSGIFSRIVKSPLLAVGSPSRTANCAPEATNGGAGPHLICSGVNAFCGVPGCANRADTQTKNAMTSIFFMKLASWEKRLYRMPLYQTGLGTKLRVYAAIVWKVPCYVRTSPPAYKIFQNKCCICGNLP